MRTGGLGIFGSYLSRLKKDNEGYWEHENSRKCHSWGSVAKSRKAGAHFSL